MFAEQGFDPRTSGLWAQYSSTAPLCLLLTVKQHIMGPCSGISTKWLFIHCSVRLKKCWFLLREENRRTRRKTLGAIKDENPHDAGFGNRTQATLVGGRAISPLPPFGKNISELLLCAFSQLYPLNVVVAEWLRRWTRNPLGSTRAGSNPADYVRRLASHQILFFNKTF